MGGRDVTLRVVDSSRLRVGLCEDCRHSRQIPTQRNTVFWRCGRSDVEPAYPRYPVLPVLRCDGYERETMSRENS